MTEYTKLTTDDNNSSYTSKFLGDYAPSWKKMLKNKNKENISSQIELSNLSLKNNNINSYNNNNYYNKMTYSRISQENSARNNARKGNMNMFLYNKNDEPLIVLGPEWFSCVIVITFFLFLLFLYFYFLKNLINPTIQYYGKILCFIDIILYLICFFKNPGIPPKELWIENYFKNRNSTSISDDGDSYRICNICKIVRRNKDNTQHCEECNICIKGVEHHCSWISKCISSKNKKLYFVFLISTFLLLLYFILALVSLIFIRNTSPTQDTVVNNNN